MDVLAYVHPSYRPCLASSSNPTPKPYDESLKARRGHGRPPEALPSRVWGLGRTLSSFIGWSQETESLPPLSLSGPHAHSRDEQSDGAVQHQSGVALSEAVRLPCVCVCVCLF